MTSTSPTPDSGPQSSMESLRTRRRIAVLVQTSSAWSRQVLAGVAEYAMEAGGWDFWIEPRGFYEQIEIPQTWRGEGVICRLTSEDLVRQIQQRRLPAVNVSWLGEHSPTVPKVVSDEVACGQMAAEFYLNRGWHFFGFVGPPPQLNYSDKVEQAFVDTLAEAKRTVKRFDHEPSTDTITIGQEHPKMAEWLMGLPKPVALLVWTTAIGQEIALFCGQIGISVPDDVAILAVELDPLVSAMSPVPIAYIDQSPRRVGAQAAALLESMIQGAPAPDQPVLVPPRRIAERMSVDNLFVEDEVVRKAMDFIRDRMAEPIQVTDVASHVAISRRVLENRFDKALRRSPAQVIRRTKLAHAMYLLNETDLTVQEIGYQTGFFHQETFLRFFKRESGQTPTEYRTSANR
ncbi:DNA-binding transcriptional regulator [Bremerella sp. JC770]|uniref:AraC family transcriptional regulator n=1 Tax=Bremerella sp. JC770 TaxID=3232137 RepID=UPI00345B1872